MHVTNFHKALQNLYSIRTDDEAMKYKEIEPSLGTINLINEGLTHAKKLSLNVENTNFMILSRIAENDIIIVLYLTVSKKP